MTTKEQTYMKTIDMIAATFLFLGGINWGLIGIFGFNLVTYIFGEMSVLTRVFYILVGISAIYDAAMWKAIQKRWECAGSWGKPKSAEA